MKFILVLISLLTISGCVPNPMGSKSSKSSFDPHFYPFLKLPGAFSITSSSVGDANLTVSWSASANSSSYDLRFKTSSAVGFTTVENVTPPYSLTGLSNGEAYVVQIRARNLIGATDSKLIQLMPITTVPTPPVANNFLDTTIYEDIERTILLSYIDANGDQGVSCSVSALVNITNTQACTCSDGVCSVKVKGLNNYSGPASFDFSVVTDQLSNTATANLTVNPVDDAPVASNLTPSALDLSVQRIVTLSYTDIEGDAATSCSISGLSNLSVTSACSCSAGTCTVGVTSSTYVDGTAAFNYRVRSNGLFSNVASVALTVNPPTFNPILSYSASTGTTVSFGNSMLVTPSTLDPNGSTITNCTSSPALPAWASLNTSTCVISGTPTSTMSPTAYTITATSANGSSPGANVTLSVNGAGPIVSYAGASGTTVDFGQTVNIVPTTLNPNGSAITNCTSAPALPAWANLDSTTCVISGVPTTSLAATTYTITAINSIGSSAGANVTITVDALAPDLSYSGSLGTTGVVGTAMTVNPTILNSNGEAITSCTSSPALPVWASLNPANCSITGTPTSTLTATTYTITASNSVGPSLGAAVTLTVNATTPVVSYAGALGTMNFVGSPVTVTPTTLENNGSAITNCTASPALPIWATLDPNTCVITGTPDATLASTSYTVTATNAMGSSTGANVTLTMISFTCPGGFIEVPENAGLNVARFCVMQFEAKDNASVATSQASGTPWVGISQTDASNACTGLGDDYDLITNPEWISIARNAESVASNWSGGLGVGYIPRGHSDGSPVNPLAVSNTADPFSDTGEVSGEQRRTLTLSNGSVIWDFAGNASEWVDWQLSSGLQAGPVNCSPSSSELPAVSCAGLNPNDYLPVDATLNSLNGVGTFYGGPEGATVRGGHWNEGDVAGAFSLNFNYSDSADSNIGFRCANRPKAEAPPVLSYTGSTGTTGAVGEPMLVQPTSLEANGAAIINCVSTPALPAWATLDTNTCEISGTPTAAFSATVYTITASNSAGDSAGASLSLTVTNNVPEVSYLGAFGTNGAVDVAMSVLPTLLDNKGSAVTSCTSSPTLPLWAAIDPLTCEISGIPDNILMASTYTITASNAVGSSLGATVTLSVQASAPVISYSGATGTTGSIGVSMSVLPTLLEENGSAISNCTVSPALPGWATLNITTCEILGTPNATQSSTTYYVSATNSAGTSTAASVSLRVNASAPVVDYTGSSGTTVNYGAPMSVTPTTLINNGSPIISCSTSTALPAWASIDPSTCVISGTPNEALSPTSYIVTAANTAGSSAGASVTLAVNALAPTISYAGATGTSGTVGAVMSVFPTTLSANGSPITNCTVTPALPTWATLNTTSCEISGTPDNSLVASAFNITAINAIGSSSAAAVSISVNAAVPNISYAGATGTSGAVGVGMSVTPTTLNENGAAISNCTSAPALPAWASLDPNTCVITGTPNAILSSTNFAITATNSAGSSTSATVNLTVVASVPSVSYSSSTGTTINYGDSLSVVPSLLNNNGATITNCASSPALPAWATINTSNCVISGTATNSLSAVTYTITATNSVGTSTGANVTLTVNPIVPTISYVGALGTSGVAAVAMSVTPTTLDSNGAAITNCASSPALPTWATLNTTTCVISGTPDDALMATIYTITATNSAGNSIGADVTLSVSASAPTLSYSGATGTTGTYGSAMSVSPTTLNDNGAAISNCTISPALPAWATLNTSTCVISGTPTAALSATTYTVTASNSVGTSSGASVTLTVNALAPTLSYTGATGTTINADDTLSVSPTTLTENGAAVTSCSSSPALPAWASIDQSTCVISGSPTEALAATTYTITASNTGGSSSGAAVTLTVNAVAPTLSYATSTGTTGYVGSLMSVTPSTLKANGSAITSCTISPALPAWASIDNTNCVISGTPSGTMSATTYTVTANNSIGSSGGQAVTLTVEVLSAPTLSYVGASGTSGLINTLMTVAPTTLDENGASITSCTISPTLPAWASINNTTCVISGTPTATLASTTYTITATNSEGSASDTVTLDVNADVPSISYAAATGTTVSIGSSMSVTPSTFNGNGATVTSCTSSPVLPSGLSINSSTCVISGSPDNIQAATSYTITATNSVGSSNASVTLTVEALAPQLSYSGATGTTGNAGSPMTVTPTTLEENGAAISNCTITPSLPTGLSLNTTTCVISGTPSSILSSTTYSVTAFNSVGSSSPASVTLTVNAAVPTISYASSTGTTIDFGNSMSVTPSTLSGNGSPITGCTSSPSLPAWATLNATTCVISGTPDAALAATTYTITASNSSGPSAGATVTLEVNALVPSLSFAGATGTAGAKDSPMTVAPTSIEANGSTITSCTSTPGLPTWATLNQSNCTISGTPTSPQDPTTYIIKAINGVGTSAGASVTISVSGSTPTISYVGSLGTNGVINVPMTVTPSSLNDNGFPISNCTSSPSLPVWATLNTVTCEITGTPDAVMMASIFTISATNSQGTSTADVTISVDPGVPTLSYDSSVGKIGTFGSFMHVVPSTLEENGSSISNCTSSPALPTWATLDPYTCEVYGTPDDSLVPTGYTITASNSAGDSIGSYLEIKVNPATPLISYDSSTGTTINYGETLSVTPSLLDERGAVISGCTISPALPTWASINTSTCVISGSAESAINGVTYTVVATNSAGDSAGAFVTITVNALAPNLSYSASTGTTGLVGSPMTIIPSTMELNGGDLTSCVSNPALPSGLTLNQSNCEISGSPSVVVSAQTYTITATNSAGSSAGAPVTITANPDVPEVSYADSKALPAYVDSALNAPPTTFKDNGSAVTNCTASPSLPVWATLDPLTCVVTGTPTAIEPSTDYTITITNGMGSSTTILSLAVLVCPEGFVEVPEDIGLAVPRFCVQKYEARKNIDEVSSDPLLYPWADITLADAQAACIAMGVDNHFDLISNPEWMSIARNIELTDANWSGGVSGTGMLPRGHTDNYAPDILNIQNDLDSYDGTGNDGTQAAGSGWEQRRTFELSNGEVIWDFGGNVFEWIDWSADIGMQYAPGCLDEGELFAVVCPDFNPEDYQPATAGLNNADHGVGVFYDGAAGGGTVRGGDSAAFESTPGDPIFQNEFGIYTVEMGQDLNFFEVNVGFRCVFRP